MNDSRLGKIAKNEKLPGLQIQKLNTDIAGALNKIQNLVLEEEEEKEACSEIHHLLFLRVARAVRFSLPLLTRAQKPAAPVRKESARLLARRSGEREKEGRRRGGRERYTSPHSVAGGNPRGGVACTRAKSDKRSRATRLSSDRSR